MGKFNTHGGYFSPQGYLRIDAGGSHDENPNGGVQLGKDPQGIPNMLEENEPVYNDFVYSDNIIASKDMLKKHKLPEKYAGKLFSEIADKFVDEAAIRPNDRVSNNGLNKMLVRLADAQEEQKAVEEQEELEEELAQLSPEEQQAVMQQVMAQQQAMPQEAIAADPAAQQMAAQQQVMANGGLLRKFEDGTPGAVVAEDGTQQNLQDGYLQGAMYNPSSQPTLILDPNTGNYYAAGAKPQGQSFTLPLTEVVTENPDAVDEIYYGGSIQPSVAVAFPGKSQAWVDAEVGPRSIKKQVGQSRDEFLADAYDMYQNNLPLQILTGTPGMVVSALGEAAKGNYGEAVTNLALAGAPIAKTLKYGSAAADVVADTEKAVKNAKNLAAAEKAAQQARKAQQTAVAAKAKQVNEVAKKKAALEKATTKRIKATTVADRASAEAAEKQAAKEYNETVKFFEKAESERTKLGKKADKAEASLSKIQKKQGITPGANPAGDAAATTTTSETSAAADAVHKETWAEKHPNWKRNTAIGLGTAAAVSAATGAIYGWKNSYYDPFEKARTAGHSSVVPVADEPEIDWSFARGGLIHKFEDAGKMNRATDWNQSAAEGFLPGALYNPSQQQTLILDPATGNYYTSEQLQGAEATSTLSRPLADYLASGQLQGALYPAATDVTTVRSQSSTPTVAAAQTASVPQDIQDGRLMRRGVVLYSGAPAELLGYNVQSLLRPEEQLEVETETKSNGQPAAKRVLAAASAGAAQQPASAATTSSRSAAATTQSATAVSTPATTQSQSVTTDSTRTQRMAPLPKFLPGQRADGIAPIPNDRLRTRLTPEELARLQTEGNGSGTASTLQTASRYAGLGIDAAGMLYNAFQQPTKFTARPYSPVLNYGTMPLTNPVYNPLDVNMTLNDVLASSAGNARQIVNAGQGPSTGALLLSNGYNTGKNIGNARIAVADANNQRYNDVITRRNANAQAQAQFQAGLGQRRADAINKAALRNQQTDLTLQRLNDVSETGKFTTLGQYSDSIKNALAGIGTENLRLNNLNNTPGRYYDLTQNGLVFYNPDANPEHSRGGLLKNYKKRK